MEQAPVVSFTNCTIIVHISKEDFTDIIRDLVDEGLITPQVGEQLLGEEDDKS